MNNLLITGAQYAGAISRWCDLHGKVPAATPTANKSHAEFEIFCQHLADVAAYRRSKPGLSVPPSHPPERKN